MAKSLEQDCHFTEKGTAVKTVRCEACNYMYAYRISREAVGHSSGFIEADPATAKQRAVDKLHELLEKECDPVPCPMCGWYQHDMVKRIRQLRYSPLSIAGVILFIIAGMLSFPVLIIMFSDVPAVIERRGSDLNIVLRLVWGVTLATAAVCLALRFLLAWFFDPNKADVESRIQLGRSRAFGWER
jgi:hypothetical protein